MAPAPWWLATAGLALMIAAGFHAGESGGRAVLPYLVVPAIALGVLARASRGRIRVADAVLHVPGARIPVAVLGAVSALDREDTRRVRGPLAQPRAYVVTRPWLPRAVRVQVEDPEDDTPYWLVGTRRPEALAQALESERTNSARR